MAAKTSLSVRVDALGEADHVTLGLSARSAVERRLQQLENGAVLRASNKAIKNSTPIPKYDSKRSLEAPALGREKRGYDATQDISLPSKRQKKESPEEKEESEEERSEDDEMSDGIYMSEYHIVVNFYFAVKEPKKNDKKEKKQKKSKKESESESESEEDSKKKSKKDKKDKRKRYSFTMCCPMI